MQTFMFVPSLQLLPCEQNNNKFSLNIKLVLLLHGRHQHINFIVIVSQEQVGFTDGTGMYQ